MFLFPGHLTSRIQTTRHLEDSHPGPIQAKRAGLILWFFALLWGLPSCVSSLGTLASRLFLSSFHSSQCFLSTTTVTNNLIECVLSVHAMPGTTQPHFLPTTTLWVRDYDCSGFTERGGHPQRSRSRSWWVATWILNPGATTLLCWVHRNVGEAFGKGEAERPGLCW